MSRIKLKVTKNVAPIRLANVNFAYVPSPASRPTVTTSAISDLSGYSNTSTVLDFDATTYANAVNYVDSRGFVNSSQLAANLTNYTPTANLQVSTLSDVVVSSLSNNATLVYNSANNKYIVKQLDVDGGSF